MRASYLHALLIFLLCWKESKKRKCFFCVFVVEFVLQRGNQDCNNIHATWIDYNTSLHRAGYFLLVAVSCCVMYVYVCLFIQTNWSENCLFRFQSSGKIKCNIATRIKSKRFWLFVKKFLLCLCVRACIFRIVPNTLQYAIAQSKQQATWATTTIITENSGKQTQNTIIDKIQLGSN